MIRFHAVLGLFALGSVVEARAAESGLALQYGGPAWSPYLVGVLIGLLVCVSLLVSGKSIGASSAYACLAGMIGKRVAKKRTLRAKYYQKNPPHFDYSVVFIAAVAVGAFIAAWSGGELRGEMLPDYWVDLFGEESVGRRFLWASFGGVLLSFGARLAGGCTSGHGISGALQLNAVSWIALICFFVGGAITANLIYAG